MGEFREAAKGAATWRLGAIGGPGQTDFAHVVSTNYSQHKMWYFDGCSYDVNHEQDLGLESVDGRTRGEV
jgi:hypothetical protein